MSKIEVNTVEPQCGTTLTVGKCTTNVAVPGNVVKSNALQASDGGNIVSQSGTDITLGASGDTINLASGASQSGFGRTGTVDWQTGSIKTAGFTPTNGEGYFCDTSGGAFAVTLPAGSAGNIVAFADYTRTFNSNNLTITPNGAEKIGGIAASAALDVDGQSATFVYVDGTEGWININETQTSQTGVPPAWVVATSPCVATVGDYKIHTFLSPGSFVVTCAGNAAGNNKIDYLVVAGGGGGSGGSSGGGGAGGYRESQDPASAPVWTASPLKSATSLELAASPYPITVGAGGPGAAAPPGPPPDGTKGSDSIFSSITSTGGGEGKAPSGGPGGSGGGGSPCGAGGTGNTPPTTPSQGNDGGSTGPAGGGGGGAGEVGCTDGARAGGDGVATDISNASVTYAGGGGGGAAGGNTGGVAGDGGGGAGGNSVTGSPGSGTTPGAAGTINTGGGAGGGGYGCGRGGGPPQGAGGLGGSGIVIIRYKFQN